MKKKFASALLAGTAFVTVSGYARAANLKKMYTFPTSLGTSFQGPLQANGNLLYGELVTYVDDTEQRNPAVIVSYDTSTGAVATVASGFLDSTSDPLYVSSTNSLYVAGNIADCPGANPCLDVINVGTGAITHITVKNGATGGSLQYISGVLYGMTSSGGTNGTGQIYSVTLSTGKVKYLYSLPYSLATNNGFSSNANGVLYGTSSESGIKTGDYASVYSFNLSTLTYAEILGQNGLNAVIRANSFDTYTVVSGQNIFLSGPGGPLQIAPQDDSSSIGLGTLMNTPLSGSDSNWAHNFTGSAYGDGEEGLQFLIPASQGPMLDTTSGLIFIAEPFGGTNGAGMIGVLDPVTNYYAALVSFSGTNGFGMPYDPPTLGADGNLYGLTSAVPCPGCNPSTVPVTIYRVTNLPTKVAVTKPTGEFSNGVSGASMVATTCSNASVPYNGVVVCPASGSIYATAKDASGNEDDCAITSSFVKNYTGTDGQKRVQYSYGIKETKTGNPSFSCYSSTEFTFDNVVDYLAGAPYEVDLSFYTNEDIAKMRLKMFNPARSAYKKKHIK